MKTKFSFFITCFVAMGVALLSIGCQNNKSLSPNQIEFSKIRLDTIEHLGNDTTKPACKFDLEVAYPITSKDSKQLTELQHLFNESYFGLPYKEMTPSQASRAFMNTYLKDYRKLISDYDTYKNSDDSEWGISALNYESKISSEIDFNSNELISFNVSSYIYTGGAHGMSGNSNHTLNLKTLSFLELSDLFAESNYSDIGELIIKALAKAYKVSDPAQLNDEGFFSIEEVIPTDNFMVTEKGITWSYNPYEIAVYAEGIIDVTLDWSEIRPYLIEDSPLLSVAQLFLE